MRCESCQGTGERLTYVLVPPAAIRCLICDLTSQERFCGHCHRWHKPLPCFDCGGSGVASCCDAAGSGL